MFRILDNPTAQPEGAAATKQKPGERRKRWYRSPKLIRHGVMLFFFVFLVRVAYHHMEQGGGPNGTPSVEAYCPFGGIETLYQFITTGGYVRRIEPSALILLGAVVLLTLMASRGFCGWICPFGSIQEWIGILGKKIFRKRFNPTGRWDRMLRPLKYVVLGTIVALTWWTGSLVFRDYDPFLAFFHLGQHMGELKWAYGILGVVLAGSLFIERFFCKYACPLGAVVGIVGKFGITHIERDAADCKECNLCQKKCHAHVEFLPHREIRSAECNHCLDCVVDCPKPNVLSVKGWNLRFSHGTYGVVLLAGFFGLVGISQLSGNWQTKPERMSLADTNGALDAGSIRGWMTLKDVSDGFRIPLAQLYAGAGIASTVPPDARLNKVGEEFQEGFSPEAVRDFVDAFLHTGTTAGPRPPDAGPVKTSHPVSVDPVPSPGQRKQTPTAHSEGPGRRAERGRDSIAGGSGLSPEGGKGLGKSQGSGMAHAEGEDPEVKGFMTLNEIVLKTGVPKSFLMEQLGLSEEISGTEPVRSWMHAQGKSIVDLRQAVSAYRARPNQ